jgi:hypothetical protein
LLVSNIRRPEGGALSASGGIVDPKRLSNNVAMINPSIEKPQLIL